LLPFSQALEAALEEGMPFFFTGWKLP
jgi:hypothetical protein